MDKTQQVIKETQNIQKEGFLEKQSRFLKSWRQRWVVLTPNFLYTFKERKQYHKPTESILLKDIFSIRAAEEQFQQQNSLKIQAKDATFYIRAESTMEKEAWIGAIGTDQVIKGKAMVKANHAEIDD